MPRPLLVEHAVELPVAPDEVGRALLDLGATERADGSYIMPIEADPAADGALTARLSPNDDGTTHVDIAAGNRIRLPFFHAIVTTVVSIHYEQAIARLAAQLEHRCADGPEAAIKPIRRNPLLPPQPYTRTQAVGLSTAGFAVAIATFGQAIVAQYSKGIQTTFFAHTSHPDTKLSIILAVIRVGAFLSLFAGILSDKIGRRRLILVSLVGLAIANLLSAIPLGPYVFTGFQTFSRGFALTVVAVGGIIALEEAPEGARGFATSMLALAGGFGFTLAVVLLPVFGKHHWQLVFVLSALFGVLTLRVSKFLKESPRFEKIENSQIRRGRIGEVLSRQYRWRFLVIAMIGFLTNILTAPSSVVTNNYLTDDRGFSYTKILLWRFATTSYTGLIGLALAGTLIERYGRRPTAFITLALGGLVRIGFYLGSGWVLWATSAVGDMVFAIAFLTIATLNVELFPTEARGTSIGMAGIIGVMGSIVGILASGIMSDHFNGWGPALAICTIPTLVAAVLFVPFLPETKGRKLDEISPSEIAQGMIPP
jgi:MFS family permease